MFRIGNGYDVHRLVEGIPLRVGGINIDYHLGLIAHSDGDVLIHALCDAILGAAALGDIGSHFPDSSDEFKGVDSTELLSRVCEVVRSAGYELCNVDCTIVAQAPKFAPYIQDMRQKLAEVMALDVSRVSVKATTTERLGFEGRGEGISSQASALIKEK